MAKRDSMADVMQALGIIADAASNIHSTNVRARLDVLDKEARKEEREDRQAFQREGMRMQTKLQYQVMHPGITFKEDGFTPDLEKYDITKSTAYKTANLTSTADQLREWGLSTEGTDDQIIERHATYLQAKSKGQHIMTPFVSPGAAVSAGYDVSPGYLTTQDVVDFEDQFYGAGGAESPIAIQQLVDSGVINVNQLYLDKDTGLYSAIDPATGTDTKVKELINTSMQGLKAGVQANRNYKTTEEYETALKDKRLDAALYAERMTGHPGVIMATRELTGAAASVGKNYVGYAINPESGLATILWKGEVIAIEDLPIAINNLKGFSPDEKTRLTKYYEILKGVGGDGSNIAPALDELVANPDLIKLLSRVDVGLASSLRKAKNKYVRLNKVASFAGGFIDQPEDVRAIPEFREYIKGSGLSQALQKYRALEIQGGDQKALDDLGVQIDTLIGDIKVEINESGDKKMLQDFIRWMELEDVTAELYKESAKGRIGQ
jgi:hypothetical protein